MPLRPEEGIAANLELATAPSEDEEQAEAGEDTPRSEAEVARGLPQPVGARCKRESGRARVAHWLAAERRSLCETAPGLDVSVSGIAGGSTTDCSGVVFEPERWYCLQAHVTREGSRLGVSLAVDGESVLEQQYERLGPGWNGRGSFLELGQAAYGPSARGSVWQDDVAVGRQPLSCTP